jgi:hypothetical protein
MSSIILSIRFLRKPLKLERKEREDRGLLRQNLKGAPAESRAPTPMGTEITRARRIPCSVLAAVAEKLLSESTSMRPEECILPPFDPLPDDQAWTEVCAPTNPLTPSEPTVTTMVQDRTSDAVQESLLIQAKVNRFSDGDLAWFGEDGTAVPEVEPTPLPQAASSAPEEDDFEPLPTAREVQKTELQGMAAILVEPTLVDARPEPVSSCFTVPPTGLQITGFFGGIILVALSMPAFFILLAPNQLEIADKIQGGFIAFMVAFVGIALVGHFRHALVNWSQ